MFVCLSPSPNVATTHRYVHLLSNVLVALVVGIPLEMVHKGWRLLLLYVAGVVAGSLAASMFDPTVSSVRLVLLLLFFSFLFLDFIIMLFVPIPSFSLISLCFATRIFQADTLFLVISTHIILSQDAACGEFLE